MGPRRFRRGNLAGVQNARARCVASMGPRRFRRGNARSRSGSPIISARFNGAATFPPRKSCAGATGTIWDAGFNGAATFPPRKYGTPGRAAQRPGPLQWCSFNGAATFPPRKYLRVRNELPALPCFNGAATFPPRKLLERGPCGKVITVLQWGRDVSAAEIYHLRAVHRDHQVASMGPRRFRRGNLWCRRLGKSMSTGFNGAATFPPRK